jgi:hypothetical protein
MKIFSRDLTGETRVSCRKVRNPESISSAASRSQSFGFERIAAGCLVLCYSVIEHENGTVMRLLLWMSGGRVACGTRTPHLLLFVLLTLLVGGTTEVEVSLKHLQDGSPSDQQTFYRSILSESRVGGPASAGSLAGASLSSPRLRQTSLANLTLRLAPPSKLNWASSDNPFRAPIIAAPTFIGQGNCGACWAFVAAHAAQAAVNIAFGEYYRKATAADSRLASSRRPPADASGDSGPDKLLAPPLSVQELVDCDAQGYNHACEGGDPYWALYYTLNEGLHSRDAYPAYAQEVSVATAAAAAAVDAPDAALSSLRRRNAASPATSIGNTRRLEAMRTRSSRCATTSAVCSTCCRRSTRRSAARRTAARFPSACCAAN